MVILKATKRQILETVKPVTLTRAPCPKLPLRGEVQNLSRLAEELELGEGCRLSWVWGQRNISANLAVNSMAEDARKLREG